MRICRNIFGICLSMALVLFAVFGQVGVAAPQIDTNRSASITIDYCVNDKPVSDVKFELFRIADVDESGQYAFLEDFAEYSTSLDGLTASARMKLADTLSSHVTKAGIEANAEGSTDQNGKLIFSVNPGLYLVTGSKYVLNSNTYTIQPILVELPLFNAETQEWQYQVVSEPKSSSSSDGGGIRPPKRTTPTASPVPGSTNTPNTPRVTPSARPDGSPDPSNPNDPDNPTPTPDGSPDPSNPNDPDNPTPTPDGSPDPSNPKDPDNPRYQDGSTDKSSPKTGDDNMIVLWIVLAVVFAAGAVWAIYKSDDKRKRNR